MTNYDVVIKLIGEIRPVGDSSIDRQRLENLKDMIRLHEEMHAEIDSISRDFLYDNRWSVAACRDEATKYIALLKTA